MKLLSPLISPAGIFSNRIVMAPMNRRRAEDGVPPAAAATYFAQRAGAGLILTDNVAVTSNGFGYLHTPGIYTTAQRAGWKSVADAVHAQNGKVFMQLVQHW